MEIKPIQLHIAYNFRKDIYGISVIDNDMPLWVDTFPNISELEIGIEFYQEEFDNERGVEVIYHEVVKERIEKEKLPKRNLIFTDGSIFQNAQNCKVLIENGEIGVETEDGEMIWAKLIGFSKEGHYVCEHI